MLTPLSFRGLPVTRPDPQAHRPEPLRPRREPGGRASLFRRNRVLAHLQPILDIERDKNAAAAAGGRDWSPYDTRLLVVAALDAVASEAGLHADGGVPREVVVAAIAAEAGRCAPDRVQGEHVEVAGWILDRLLNTQAAATGFRVPFTDPARDYARRELVVTVLFEQVASDGETILVFAADAAINLLLVTIDFDLEDAQVAADAVLKVQLDSGRWADAVDTAAKALRLSRSYRDQLHGKLAAVRRDIRQVDWESAVEPLLARANTHIRSRLGAEQALLEHAARSATTDADNAIRREASRVATMLEEALELLAGLLQDVLDARATFREAQAAQSFRPPAPVGLIDIEADILEPLAALTTAAAGPIAEPVALVFSGPRVEPVPSIARILDALLEPPRELDQAIAIPEDELIDIASRYSRFDDADWEVARARYVGLGAEPQRLSALIDGLDREPATLIALLAMRAYDANGRPAVTDAIVRGVIAADDGELLDHPAFLVPDLVLSRPAAAEAEAEASP
jgi:hypothetical protein